MTTGPADWLINLSEQPALLAVKPVRSELVYLLVGLDKEYAANQPGEPWETYYAPRLLTHFTQHGRWASDHRDQTHTQPQLGDHADVAAAARGPQQVLLAAAFVGAGREPPARTPSVPARLSTASPGLR